MSIKELFSYFSCIHLMGAQKNMLKARNFTRNKLHHRFIDNSLLKISRTNVHVLLMYIQSLSKYFSQVFLVFIDRKCINEEHTDRKTKFDVNKKHPPLSVLGCILVFWDACSYKKLRKCGNFYRDIGSGYGDMRHCVKSVQIRSFFWSVFSCIRTKYRDLLFSRSERERNTTLFYF